MQVPDEKEPKNVPWKPEATSAYWINRASRLLLKLHDARLRPLGLGINQLPILDALHGSEPLSQKELAQRARVEQPTMAEMLSRMERDGIVQRRPNPEDKRGSLTSLTPSARAKVPKAKAELMRGEEDATRGLRSADKEKLVQLLRQVVENLEKLPTDPPP